MKLTFLNSGDKSKQFIKKDPGSNSDMKRSNKIRWSWDDVLELGEIDTGISIQISFFNDSLDDEFNFNITQFISR